MDHDRIMSVIDRIYDSANGNVPWADLMNDLADASGAALAWSVFSAPKLGINTVIAPRSDPVCIRDYQRYWWTKDVTMDATRWASVGRITSLDDTGRDRFAASEFYNDFWRNSGHARERLASNLVVGDGTMATIGIQPSRTHDSIEADTARAFEIFVPHLVRAVEIRWTLRRLRLERNLAISTPDTGVILVGRDARPIVMDPIARQIIGDSSGIAVVGGHVVLADAADTNRLHFLVACCGGTGGLHPKGGRILRTRGADLCIEVLPYSEAAAPFGPEYFVYPPPTAMLILSEPMRRRQLFLCAVQKQFGLTNAEAAVAFELMQGDHRAAVAARLGVSLATVRTHMMHIYAKTGVQTRSALIGRLYECERPPPDCSGSRASRPDS
jgi:DNA-binding CsgD family transcriptional regulator